MWKNTQATILKSNSKIEQGDYNPLLSGSALAYTPGGTRYYYEFEYYVNGTRYVGNIDSNATIREMKLCFYDKSSPSIINIKYNSKNPNKYRIPLLKKYIINSVAKGILIIVLLILCTYGLLKVIIGVYPLG